MLRIERARHCARKAGILAIGQPAQAEHGRVARGVDARVDAQTRHEQQLLRVVQQRASALPGGHAGALELLLQRARRASRGKLEALAAAALAQLAALQPLRRQAIRADRRDFEAADNQ